MASGRRPGWVRFAVGAAGSLAVGAVNLGIDLAANTASGTTRWPWWLRLIPQHPWPATGALAAVATVLGGAALWLRARQEAGGSLRAGAVEAAPTWAVPRLEAEQVVQAVLNRRHSGAVGITAGVHGAGGFGKSTVAQLVCADRRCGGGSATKCIG